MVLVPDQIFFFYLSLNSPDIENLSLHCAPNLSFVLLSVIIFATLNTTVEGNGTPLQYSCLENPMDGGAWWAAVLGVAKSQTRLSDFTFTFHFHAQEKEMATHSSVLAWRVPGTGSHRVGDDCSDLAAAVNYHSYLFVCVVLSDYELLMGSQQYLIILCIPGSSTQRDIRVEWIEERMKKQFVINPNQRVLVTQVSRKLQSYQLVPKIIALLVYQYLWKIKALIWLM